MTSVNVDVPERALAIGAHPDDIEFGCGATLAKWAGAGCAVSLLICTDGSKGTWDVNADTRKLIERRKQEQAEAARRLRATGDVLFLGEVDGELEVTMALRSRIAKIIRQQQPGVVLAHDPWKRWRLHPDHRAAGFLSMDAVVAARDAHFYPDHGVAHHRPAELLLFECEEPDHAETVTRRHLDTKVAALLAHESQFESTHKISATDDADDIADFTRRVVERCRDTGRLAGVEFAEAFRRVERV